MEEFVLSSVKLRKVYERIYSLVDKESFIEINKLEGSGVVTGFGYVDQKPVYIFAQDFDQNSGAVSKSHCDKIIRVYDLALKTGIPIIGIYDSIGAKVCEGAELVKSYSKLIAKSNELSGIIPQVAIVVGPCIGSMSLIAMSSDFLIMTEGTELGIRTDGTYYQSQEALNQGIVHINSKDEPKAFLQAKKIILLIPSNNMDVLTFEDVENIRGVNNFGNKFIDSTVDTENFIELNKEWGNSFKVGIARLGGLTVGLIASENEIIDSPSCLKATRLVRFCDAFSIPIITFIDAEKFENLKSASGLINAYSETTSIKISVITGKAYGSICIAFCGDLMDFCIAFEDSVISLLPSQTHVAAFDNDKLKSSENPIVKRKELIKEFTKTEASPEKAAHKGLISNVVTLSNLRENLFSVLEIMSSKKVNSLPKKHSNIQI